MRLIGHIETEDAAAVFLDYLLVNGIETQIEANEAGRWEVWVVSEGDLLRAREALDAFLRDPAQPMFQGHEAAADRLRKQELDAKRAAAKRMKGAAELFGGTPARVTLTLMVISVVVTLPVLTTPESPLIRWLTISQYQVLPGFGWWQGLPEIKNGQVWRLVTPIFLHFGWLHIIFNMMWLYDLGRMLERINGWWRFLALVLVSAVLSNLAQYAVSGPSFGGMSGVVYALLGYSWMQSKFNPLGAVRLNPSTMTFMLVWLGLGFMGFMHMANTVHLVGLLVGVGWGYLSARRAAR